MALGIVFFLTLETIGDAIALQYGFANPGLLLKDSSCANPPERLTSGNSGKESTAAGTVTPPV